NSDVRSECLHCLSRQRVTCRRILLSCSILFLFLFFFFFNDTATTEIYTLSLHDALPILSSAPSAHDRAESECSQLHNDREGRGQDRKSTRLNSSHRTISYAVFCLKKKKNKKIKTASTTNIDQNLQPHIDQPVNVPHLTVH